MDKLKIMIVEDESLLAMVIEKKLKRAGYEVCQSVATGEEAVAYARMAQPDAILMDIRLAGAIDGIEAARQIGEFSSARIIFATGYSEAKVKDRALALKPAGYLVKPVEVEAIEALLKKPGPVE